MPSSTMAGLKHGSYKLLSHVMNVNDRTSNNKYESQIIFENIHSKTL